MSDLQTYRVKVTILPQYVSVHAENEKDAKHKAASEVCDALGVSSLELEDTTIED